MQRRKKKQITMKRTSSGQQPYSIHWYMTPENTWRYQTFNVIQISLSLEYYDDLHWFHGSFFLLLNSWYWTWSWCTWVKKIPKQLMLVMMRLLCLASEHNVPTEAFLNGPLRPKTRKTYRRRNFLNRKKDIHLNDELVKRNMFYCRSWQRCNDIFSQSLE